LSSYSTRKLRYEVRAITIFPPRRPFEATGASGAGEYMLGLG